MTNNKQQTAVEWGIEKLASLTFDYMAGFISKREYDQLSKGVIRQAKEMEKERIENAFNSGYNNGGLDTCLTPKQYYKQTYGGGEQ
jgi:hypothetical protein